MALAIVKEEVRRHSLSGNEGCNEAIRTFKISLGDVIVELCNVGASITKLILPSYSTGPTNDDERDDVFVTDDCVLGFENPNDMITLNSDYFGSVVGRVANRIKEGKFSLIDNKKSDVSTDGHGLLHYTLDINNEPNHLHGGIKGFSHKVWEASVLESTDDGYDATAAGVKFTLVSENGDQGYPSSIQVTATYTLFKRDQKTVLRLTMSAGFNSSSEQKATPINLSQHSYFNLAGHNSPMGILDHNLILFSDSYTPIDHTGIPTKAIKKVSDDSVFDFRTPGKNLGDALDVFGREQGNVEPEENSRNFLRNGVIATARYGCAPFLTPGNPFGYDHNFCVQREKGADGGEIGGLYEAAILEHPRSGRKMTVRTDAPGVQIYTGNFLRGAIPNCKNGASYRQWQGICLETQAFPDSISSNANTEFLRAGGCFILQPGGDDYEHNVEYEFENISSKQ